MAGKKTGKRLLTCVLVLVMALSLLPLNALAENGGSPHDDVVNGYYDDSGAWKQGVSSVQPDVPGIVSVNKTAARAANTNPKDNTYEVTLRVETEGIKDTNKAATVLVIDTSASMNECMKEEHTHNEDCYTFTGSECTSDSNPGHWWIDIFGEFHHKKFVDCNYDRKTGKHYITDEKVRICGKEEHSHRDGNCYTRLDAAKKAAIDFLDSYRNGAQSGSGRYVALVAFNKTASNSTAWNDVSSSADYTAAKQWINGLSANGGTNLDAGLSAAGTRFSEAPVSSIAAENRNIIVLTDGEPTYCLDSDGDVSGSGRDSTSEILKATNATATKIRDDVCPIHTICFAAGNEKISTLAFGSITLSEYLETYIASDGKAYNASSYKELTDAFSAISDIITSQLTEAVVHDSLPAGVTETNSNLFNSNGKVTWSLFDDFDKEETAGGTTVYTKTYTVTIDPEAADKANGEYCPLNGQTTLTVKSQRTPNGATLPFPIPAGLVTVQNTPAPELSVKKAVTKVGETTVAANETIPTAYPGDTIEWTITVTNSGNAEGDFTLKETLSGITVKDAAGSPVTLSNNEWRGTVEAGRSVSYTVTYTVKVSDVTENGLVNTVTMNSDGEVSSAPVPTAQKYTVTGTIDNDGTVTNPSQKVKPGEKSTAMTFTPADGYKIISVTVNGTAVSDLTLNSNGSYTYPAMDSVTQDIAVIVRTDKRTDLSYTVKYVDKITDNEIQPSVVKNGKTFGDTITGESEKVIIANYTYVEAKPAPLTIGTDVTKNVITLYYTKDAPTPGTFDFNDVFHDGKNTPAITKTVKGNVGRNFKETFKVTVKGADEKSAATMSAPASYTGEAKVTYSNRKDIAFQFNENDKLTFRNEGKYIYTVWEIPDGTSRMSYDTTKYTLTINVVLDEGSNTYQVKSWQFTPGNREYTTALNIVNTYRTYHPSTPSKPTLNTGDHYAYVMGYPDGTVRPNGSITRAEVSAILFRLLSDKTRDEYFTTESSFTDVKAGAWYNNSIATLEKAGVIVDTAKGGAFRPNEAITRAELAAMLAQFSDAKPVKGVKFSDVSAEHWAYEAIAIAAKMGWIEGYPDGTFRPDATITRAEMMTLVNRALERVPSDEDHLLSKRVMLTFPDCKSGDWFYIAVQEATNSHTYERAATEKNGDEQWIALRANRDWTQLEK